jgi:peptide/nickel transport system permease protein
VIRYLIRRLLWALVLFFAVTVVTYVIFFLIPADPAQRACGQLQTQQCLEQAHHFLGLDRPVYVQYGKFFGRLLPFDVNGLVHGHSPIKTPSLGISFANRQQVNSIVGGAAPVTASLVFGGAIVWLLLALPVGILSALRPRSLLDRAGMVFVLVGLSAHPVWIGLIFAYFFGYKLGLTPIAGYCDAFSPSASADCGGPVQWAYHMVLPWATFAILFAALYVRLIRANVMETMNEDYVRTARSKGAPENRVIRSHILRNSLLPVVTMLGMDVGVALGGSVFIENVFTLHGLGLELVTATNRDDVPVVVGVVVFVSLAVIAANFLIDLAYTWLDPRVRLR